MSAVFFCVGVFSLLQGFLAAENACFLCTTIAENAAMMLEILELHPVTGPKKQHFFSALQGIDIL